MQFKVGDKVRKGIDIGIIASLDISEDTGNFPYLVKFDKEGSSGGVWSKDRADSWKKVLNPVILVDEKNNYEWITEGSLELVEQSPDSTTATLNEILHLPVIIHCPTKEEFREVQERLLEIGIGWYGREIRDYWDIYEEKICLHISSGKEITGYGKKEFYQNDGFFKDISIISAEEFLGRNIKIKQSSNSVATTPKKISKMNKLTTMLRRQLSKDSQALYKAGFIGETLELTTSGIEALQVIAFDTHKTELVVMAKEQLAEEKEDK